MKYLIGIIVLSVTAAASANNFKCDLTINGGSPVPAEKMQNIKITYESGKPDLNNSTPIPSSDQVVMVNIFETGGMQAIAVSFSKANAKPNEIVNAVAMAQDKLPSVFALGGRSDRIGFYALNCEAVSP